MNSSMKRTITPEIRHEKFSSRILREDLGKYRSYGLSRLLDEVIIPNIPDIDPKETFFYEKKPTPFKEEFIKKYKFYTLSHLSFKSPFSTDYPENNTAHLLHFIPQKRKIDFLVVTLHGWRSNRAGFMSEICRRLAESGINACLFSLPYHRERTPVGKRSGSLFFTLDPFRTFNAYRQAVIDLTVVADHFKERGFRLGGVGISIGALILNTLMGFDSRYEIGVSIVGGGDISRIVWEGLATRFVRRFVQSFGISTKHFEVLLEHQKNFLEEKRRTGKIPRTKCFWFLIDPITYASKRNVLFINGRFDPIIPREAVLEFRESCGNPPIIWIPADHFTIIFRRYIIRRTIKFLMEKSKLSE
ncbi:MAG: hypothetical protein U9R01_06130 [candidate division WOR-3 bacterium]|nr:hypothetical protein [candidate division WOR-3 bacterium]